MSRSGRGSRLPVGVAVVGTISRVAGTLRWPASGQQHAEPPRDRWIHEAVFGDQGR